MNSVNYLTFSVLIFFSLIAPGLQAQTDQGVVHTLVENSLAGTEKMEQEEPEPDNLLDLEQELLHNPVNLGVLDPIDLLRLKILSMEEIDSLFRYLLAFGPMTSVYELRVCGIPEDKIAGLLPYICLMPENRGLKNLFRALRYPAVELLLSSRTVLQQKAAYSRDSIRCSPAQWYAGDPFKHRITMRASFGKMLQAGIGLRKDPGELGPDREHPLRFDEKSMFLAINDMGFVRKLVIGQYGLSFGQGLSLGASSGFGAATNADLRLSSRGVYPTLSTTNAYTGIAFTLKKDLSKLSLFLSERRVDATVDSLIGDDKYLVFSSLSESSYHRTQSEIKKRNKVVFSDAGMHVSSGGQHWNTGLTLFYHGMNARQKTDDQLYRYFSDTLPAHLYGGLNFLVFLRKLQLFGECNARQDGAYAVYAGFSASPEPRLGISAAVSRFSKAWANPRASSFFLNPRGTPATRYHMVMQLFLSKELQAMINTEYTRYDWLRFAVSAPSSSYSRRARLDYNWSRQAGLSLLTGVSRDCEDLASETLLDTLIQVSRVDAGLKVWIQLSDRFRFKGTWRYLQRTSTRKGSGLLLTQSLHAKLGDGTWKASCQFSLFDTDSYHERMYTWEDDIYQNISIVMLYRRGYHLAAVLQWSPGKRIGLWLKYSHQAYPGQQSISSGPEEVRGNQRDLLALQLKFAW